MLVVLLSGSCSEYAFREGKAGAPGAEGTEDPSVDDHACGTLAVPEQADVDGDPTCNLVEVDDWSVVVEAAIAVGTPGSQPVVVPTEPGALPSILLSQGPELSVVAIDPSSWTTRVIHSVGGGESQSIAWAVGQDVSYGAVSVGLDIGVWVSGDTGRSWASTDIGDEGLVTIADVEGSGVARVLYGSSLVSLDGELLQQWQGRSRAPWTLPVDVDGDGRDEFLTGDGVFRLGGERVLQWPVEFADSNVGMAQLAPVRGLGDVRFLGIDGNGPLGLDASGALVWEWEGVTELERQALRETGGTFALGDVDGDQAPDMCFAVGSHVVVVSSTGETLLDDDTGSAQAWLTGGCALADLDADGNAEVVAYGPFGLHLYDVETRTLLLARSDLCTRSWENSPIVADVDGDGSAEIVLDSLAGCPEQGWPQAVVWVVGSASGSWAKTRSVWNQGPYDASRVSEDGTLIRSPRELPAYPLRAQPAVDGERPNLRVEAVDACATECAGGGEIDLVVRVGNFGSVTAAAGAEVRLYTRVGAGPIVEVASTTLVDPIPPMTWSDGFVLAVPWSEWGEFRVLDVLGDLTDECDPFDDRVEGSAIPDPCSGA